MSMAAPPARVDPRIVSTPLQARFAAAMLDPTEPGPPGLRAWNGSDPQVRLAVYRNNVVSSLVDALADTFPVVQQLVGELFFRAMAAVHVRAAPPRSPVLALYGDGFADFIEGFEPARSLPYLADMARLEHARAQAMHAADAAPLIAAGAAAALIDPTRVGDLQLHWHPSVRLLRSPHAAVSLWAAHQGDETEIAQRLAAIDLSQPEDALVLRPRLDVLVLPLPSGAAEFVVASRAGQPLAPSAAAALQAAPAFDLTAALGSLVSHGALCAIELPPNRRT